MSLKYLGIVFVLLDLSMKTNLMNMSEIIEYASIYKKRCNSIIPIDVLRV